MCSMALNHMSSYFILSLEESVFAGCWFVLLGYNTVIAANNNNNNIINMNEIYIKQNLGHK